MANEVRPCGVPRWRFAYFAATGKVGRRRGGEIPEYPPKKRYLYLTLGMSSIRPVGKLPSSSWLAWRICSMVVP